MVFETALSALAVTAVILFQAVVWIGTHTKKRPAEELGRNHQGIINQSPSLDDSNSSSSGTGANPRLDDSAGLEDKLVARLLSQTGSEMLSVSYLFCIHACEF
mmetsp:Transcript_5851/g.12171  ORF Transcript_5851/g.12171 Transcript_5851/m.12171 type:complete len:103 (+) Transcript_5851:201-509(+)